MKNKQSLIIGELNLFPDLILQDLMAEDNDEEDE